MMKKVLIFFVLILSVSLLFGCGKEESENKTDLDVYNVSNLEAYSIVRSENASDTVNKATNDLCAAFLKKTGKSVKTAKDSADEKRFEIIIGETSRKIEDTAIDKLGFSQFLIKKIGDKIVTAGGTDNAVASGVDFLIEHFIVESSLYAPIDGYLGENKKLINSLSIEGTSIENYTVVADLFDISIAESFALELETALGFALPVASLEEYELSKGRYILLSDTNSDFSKYSVKIENGNITFFANYDSLEDCKDYFFSDILNFDTEKGTAMGDRDVKITNEMSKDFTIESTPIYTKEKLYEVLETVYNDDDSLIIAQHSFPRIGDSIRFERAQYKEGCGVDASRRLMLRSARHMIWFSLHAKAVFLPSPFILTTPPRRAMPTEVSLVMRINGTSFSQRARSLISSLWSNSKKSVISLRSCITTEFPLSSVRFMR